MSTTQPLVSIIIPTFNRSDLLKECLDAVVAQTFKDFEVLIINNFSTDDTLDVIATYKDARFNVINFKNNGIIGAARNQGIKLAKGKYISFLDSDDCWHKNKLEECIKIFQSASPDVICHAEIWHDGVNPHAQTYGPSERATYDSLLFKGNCLSTSATMVTREALAKTKGFDENPELVTVEDYDLWMALAKNGAKFYFIDEPLGMFRIHSRNESEKSIERHHRALIAVFAKHFNQLQDKNKLGMRFKAKVRGLRINMHSIKAAINNKMIGNSIKYFFESVRMLFSLRRYLVF